MLWEGKETVLLSSGCLTSFLVRCMCPLPSLRQNDLTVAENDLFRHPSWRSCRLSPYAQSIAPQCGRLVHSVRNVPCKLLSTEVASRSPSSLIHHKSVFRCISIYDARLGHLVLLDRGVEADGALRRFAVSPCASLIDPLPLPSCSSSNLPFFLSHTVCGVRKVSEMLQDRGCCAVPGQRAGECCIFGTTFSGCSHLAKSWKSLHLWYSIFWTFAGLRLLSLSPGL